VVYYEYYQTKNVLWETKRARINDVASKFGKKMQKNMDDFRDSVTVIICIGSATGGEELVTFVVFAVKDKYAIPPVLHNEDILILL
tara:strand:- start:414 stop:671 length:258 start_codon:yes stop_codon:yes gene_type:complete